MDRMDLIEKMRGRVLLCRNLANATSDPETAAALRRIADEGERDLEKLIAEKTEAIRSRDILPSD